MSPTTVPQSSPRVPMLTYILAIGVSLACLVGCGNEQSAERQPDAATNNDAAPSHGSGGAPGSGGSVAGSGGTINSGGFAGGAGGPAGSAGGAQGGAMGGATGGTVGGTRAETGGTTTASQGGAGSGGSTNKGGSTGATTGGANGTQASGGNTATGTSTGGRGGTGGVNQDAGPANTGGAASTGGTTGSTTVLTGTGPAESKPTGYGQNTTGGGSKTAVDAASMAAVQAAIDNYSGSGGLVIRYTGKFNFASITDPCTQWKLPEQIVEIKKKSDITLMGADGSAANFGLHIASSSSNIIVRNMVFGLLPGADASDAISIEGMSGGVPTNIWIDHNELFSSMVECDGAGDTSFDGLIDVKKGADNITVSYNYIHDHHKVSLNGYSDSDDVVRHITFHHNVFENIGSRTPLQRHGYSHVLNNWFNGITTSGINVRMDGCSLIEANYFENAKNPVTSRDSDAIGYWELRGNNITSPADFTKFAITWSASSSTPTKDATDWTTTKTYPVALGYSYKADPPDCLKAGLKKVAGAGKGLATLKCN